MILDVVRDIRTRIYLPDRLEAERSDERAIDHRRLPLRGRALRAHRADGGWEKFFCRECGAHLFARNPDDPTEMSVRMSAFDGDPGVRPSYRAQVAHAVDWEEIPDDGLTRYPDAPPES